MRFAVLLLVMASACKALPPPPVFAPHAPTAPDEQGAITAMVVVGIVDQFLWGGDGWGVALRVERQQTDRTTIGGEITGGRGSQGQYEDRKTFRQSLLGVRAYGRTSPSHDDEIAFGYGVGVSWMRTGVVTGTLQTSLFASRPSDRFVPIGGVSLALAVPLRRGRAYGDAPMNFNLGEAEPMPPQNLGDALNARAQRDAQIFRKPALELYLGFDVGAIVPLGDTGNALSLDLGAAIPMRGRSLLISPTIADSQRFTP